MNKSIFFVFGYTLLLVAPQLSHAQTLDSLDSKTGISFRGLSVVNNRFLWVSGSKGTVGRSTDGGKHFNWLPVKGYENRDFRDIEAFDAVTAVILAIDSPGLILRTFDGGASWQEVHRDNRSGIFLDAFAFYKDKYATAIGDPINGEAVLLSSKDEGRSWQAISGIVARPDTGEACFASSGTNIVQLNKTEFTFITGGRRSRVYKDRQLQTIPLQQGGQYTGANSIAVKGKRWIVVGGDFTHDKEMKEHIAISNDRGRTWSIPSTPTNGYRSSVTAITKRKWIACGTSGVDVSSDGGETWRRISDVGYHVVQRAKKGRAVYLAGGNGRLAKLVW